MGRCRVTHRWFWFGVLVWGFASGFCFGRCRRSRDGIPTVDLWVGKVGDSLVRGWARDEEGKVGMRRAIFRVGWVFAVVDDGHDEDGL